MNRVSALTSALILILVISLSGCSQIYHRYGYGKLAPSNRTDGLPTTSVILPTDAPSISRRYRPSLVAVSSGGHNGIDLFVPLGTPVLAIADGVVCRVSFSLLFGNQIFLDHRKAASGANPNALLSSP